MTNQNPNQTQTAVSQGQAVTTALLQAVTTALVSQMAVKVDKASNSRKNDDLFIYCILFVVNLKFWFDAYLFPYLVISFFMFILYKKNISQQRALITNIFANLN